MTLLPGEIGAVWAVDHIGRFGSRSWMVATFQGWRGRANRRALLRATAQPGLAQSRTQRIVDLAAFVADPRGSTVRDPGRDRPAAGIAWRLTGLAADHLAWAMQAQSQALKGEPSAAARSMEAALDLLLASQADEKQPPSQIVAAGVGVLRDREAKALLAALARMFVAGCTFDAGGRAQAKQACDDQPGIAYLHDTLSDLFVERGDWNAAIDAALRAAAARGASETAEARLRAACRVASIAVAAAEDGGTAKPLDLLDRAEILGDAVGDSGSATARNQIDFWRGRLALARADLARKDGQPTALGDVEKARGLFRKVVAGTEPTFRVAAADWLALLDGRPLRRLHDGLVRDRAKPFGNDVRTAMRSAAKIEPPPQRLVMRIPEMWLEGLDKAQTDRLLDGDDAGDGNWRPSVAAMHRFVQVAYGVEPPSVLLRRSPGQSDRVEVLLDGVSIAATVIRPGLRLADQAEPPSPVWPAAPDWFGRPVLLPIPPASASSAGLHTLSQPEAAIVFLAHTALRTLDRVLDAGHAAALGVDGFAYQAWSPTLRLLLADRTPLTDFAALRQAVAAVAWGDATPEQAARQYRLAVKPALWGAGPDRREIVLPASIEAAVADARRAVTGQWPSADAGLVDAAADATLAFVGSQAVADGPARLVVDDPEVRPWVRAILRPRYADLPVLAREELS